MRDYTPSEMIEHLHLENEELREALAEARRALETMRVALSWLTDEALAIALHEHCKVKNELVMAGRNIMPIYDVRPWSEITDRHREDHLEARFVIEWFYHRDLEHAAKVRAAL